MADAASTLFLCHAHACATPARLFCPEHHGRLPKSLAEAVYAEYLRLDGPSSILLLSSPRMAALLRHAQAELVRSQEPRWAEAYDENAADQRRRAVALGRGDPLRGLVPVGLEVVLPIVPCLTLPQPWAWAVLHADCDIDNRDWRHCGFRGRAVLHASGCEPADYAAACVRIAEARNDLGLPPVEVPPLGELPVGGLVGVVRIVGTSPNRIADVEGWRDGRALALHLDEAVALPFVGAKPRRQGGMLHQVDLYRTSSTHSHLLPYLQRFPGSVREVQAGGAT